jgi:protein TonB
MRGDDAELKRLGDESVALKTRMQQVAQAKAAAGGTTVMTLSGDTYDISKLDRAPRPKFQARPQYPAELRRAGIEGAVVVDFIVDREGNVQNAQAIKSSSADKAGEVVMLVPFTVATEGGKSTAGTVADATKLFETAAVEAVGQWKFAAGQKGGRDVNTHMLVPIVFSLGKKEGAPESKTAAPKP